MLSMGGRKGLREMQRRRTAFVADLDGLCKDSHQSLMDSERGNNDAAGQDNEAEDEEAHVSFRGGMMCVYVHDMA